MKALTPRRASRTHVQHFEHSPDLIFPLLCPVREAEWADGWDPEVVVTESGFAEHGCVFVTGSGRDRSFWVITEFDSSIRRVRMVRVTPDVTACQVDIGVHAAADRGTHVSIAYTLTSLGPAGDTRVDEFTDAYYREFMAVWEREMDTYLRRASPTSAP